MFYQGIRCSMRPISVHTIRAREGRATKLPLGSCWEAQPANAERRSNSRMSASVCRKKHACQSNWRSASLQGQHHALSRMATSCVYMVIDLPSRGWCGALGWRSAGVCTSSTSDGGPGPKPAPQLLRALRRWARGLTRRRSTSLFRPLLLKQPSGRAQKCTGEWGAGLRAQHQAPGPGSTSWSPA